MSMSSARSFPAMLTVNYRTELPLGGYARWAAARTNVTSLTADLDGDGYANLFEYALGLDPAVPTSGALPLIVNPATLELTYQRPAAVVDVSYQVEWAATPAGPWSATGLSQQILTDDGATRTIRATLPKGAAAQRFVRLKVIR